MARVPAAVAARAAGFIILSARLYNLRKSNKLRCLASARVRHPAGTWVKQSTATPQWMKTPTDVWRRCYCAPKIAHPQQSDAGGASLINWKNVF